MNFERWLVFDASPNPFFKRFWGRHDTTTESDCELDVQVKVSNIWHNCKLPGVTKPNNS